MPIHRRNYFDGVLAMERIFLDRVCQAFTASNPGFYSPQRQ